MTFTQRAEAAFRTQVHLRLGAMIDSGNTDIRVLRAFDANAAKLDRLKALAWAEAMPTTRSRVMDGVAAAMAEVLPAHVREMDMKAELDLELAANMPW